MPDKYERGHQRNIAAVSKLIRQLYEDLVTEVAYIATTLPYKGELFSLAMYPYLKDQINQLTKELSTRIYSVVVNNIEASWSLSNEKNNVFIDKRFARKKIPERLHEALYDANESAMNRFISRRKDGLGLSKRVWNAVEPMRYELEKGIGVGLSKGQGARELASDLKKYLREPDKLFRRVRDAEGKLRLSKAAREYNPGQGVYRSSYQNALRIARTETNMAYRTADHERWKHMPFVVGLEIQLSDSHPKYDICDKLAGKYPKDFKWSGWHPNCMCYQTPIMLTDEEYEKYEDMLLGKGYYDVNTSDNLVKDVPKAFDEFIDDNAERMARWKSKPYWMSENKEFVY